MSPCLLRSLVIVASLGHPLTSAAQSAFPDADVSRRAVLDGGRLGGVVVNQDGAALGGANVLVVGTTVAAVMTDRLGRFALSLPAGNYLVRVARAGYVPALRGMVQILPAHSVERQIALAREEAGTPLDPSAQNASEIAWRLRHLSRTVLREVGHAAAGVRDLPPAALGDQEWPAAPPGRSVPVGPLKAVGTFFTETPFTGQLSLFTTTPVPQPGLADVPGWSRGIADLAIGAPLGTAGDWRVRGAMSSGSASAWGVLGEYRGRPNRRHALQIVAAYSSQAVSSMEGPAPGVPSSASSQPQTAAAVRVSDEWHVSPWFEISHTVRLDRDDGVLAAGLVSPEVGIRARVFDKTFVSTSVAQLMSGPRTDALLPSATGGPWMPPMHALASSAAWRAPVPAETVRAAHIGIDRHFTRDGDVSAGVEWFAQTVDGQMAIVFDSNPASPGDYDVVSVGDAEMVGWRMRVQGVLFGQVRGAVEFASADARWLPGSVVPLRGASAQGRTGIDHVDDLRTALSWELSRTATLVALTHRLTRVERADGGASDALSRQRVAFWLAQRAPFQPLTTGLVSLFLDIRTAFFDDESSSLYDELLTVRNPARVTGGLQVQF